MQRRNDRLQRQQSRETPRSSSTPPWFAQNCRSPSNGTEEDRREKKDGRRGAEGYASGSRGPSKRGGDKGTASPLMNPRNLNQEKAKDGSGDHGDMRTPVISTTDPECEIDLPEAEDFVEGGVELSPLLSGNDAFSPPPTRSLLLLEEGQIEGFWPSGPGMKALFLDYDGTLREFEDRPEQAVPTAELRQLLQAMNDREDYMPYIVSGRNASFLEEHFGEFSRFTLVAEHGFQIWRPEARTWALWDGTTNHDVWKAALRPEISRIVGEMPGSHLEEKASSLVWHYREVADQAKAEAKSIAVVSRLCKLVEAGNVTEQVRISHGHKIVEASYQKVRKGPVMRKLCEEKALFGEPYVGVLTAGDDVSDESMFENAPSDCLTIKVGPAKTSARCRVDTPAELRSFLWKLLKRGVATESS